MSAVSVHPSLRFNIDRSKTDNRRWTDNRSSTTTQIDGRSVDASQINTINFVNCSPEQLPQVLQHLAEGQRQSLSTARGMLHCNTTDMSLEERTRHRLGLCDPNKIRKALAPAARK